MLKATAHSIAKGIAILFNKSIELGAIPKEWKRSAVVPIPKGRVSNKPSIAHELAHSWSGNLVTNANWDDLCFNEV